ncbi:TonB-dependent siderophore receptor [Pseudomonas sp. ABC1]|uniref:TonB-dependent siderophore receptor n=1 Tax=Pseudomonas sp. ABC1 TaxID=2748080 RepID=UPI0015C2E33E|nr:TonB-dependent siderophore receptor [Pseudomonas sp. ABC1]QLF94826.1 TonB-dependent siderophore receptor [Pseudomonas sp. ABC1]
MSFIEVERHRNEWCGVVLLTAALAGVVPVLAQADAEGNGVAQLGEIRVDERVDEGYVSRNSSTATKTDTPLKETAASISIVTAERMEDQAVKSVPEALRYTAGVISEYRGASNAGDETMVRGFGYVPRYVDGLAVASGTIEPWLLENIAVLKGPASLLYGQSNPGGLIDMSTKVAYGQEINRVGLGTGSRARAEGRFDFARRLGDTALSWRVVGLASRADTQEDGLKTRRLAIAPSLSWAPTDDTSLIVSARYQREPDAGYRNFRERLGTDTTTPYGRIPADFLVGDTDHERSSSTSQSLGYSFEHAFSPNLIFRQKARVSEVESRRDTLVWGSLAADQRTISRTASDSLSETDQALIDNQLETRFGFAGFEHLLLSGFDVQYTRSTNLSWRGRANSIDWVAPVYGNVVLSNYSQSGDSLSRTRQQGVYLQDQLTRGRWHLVAGLRHDWANNETLNRLSGTRADIDSEAFSGRVGVLYTLDSGFAPYASYSTSFEPVTQVPQAGERSFDPTEGEQLEVGLKWSSPDDSLMITTSVYDLRQANVLKSIEGTTPTAYEQVGEIRSRGFEVEAQGKVTRNLSLVGGYSYIDSEISKSNNRAEVGMKNDRIPSHQASLWGKYLFDSGLDVALGARYTGASWARNEAFSVPSYTLLDLALGYDCGRLDPRCAGLRGQVNVSNLTDEYYTASCSGAYACFVGNERVISASLDYQW